MRERVEKATAIGFVLLGVAAIGHAMGYPPGARTIPILVSAVIVVTALVQLLGRRIPLLQPLIAERSLSRSEDGPRAGSTEERESQAGEPAGQQSFRVVGAEADEERTKVRRRGIQIALWTLGLLASVWLLGFVVAIPSFMFAFLAANDRASWKTHIGLTVAMGLLTYVLIVRLLYLPWNYGRFFEWLGWI